jgi:4-aminobutyrate aminotransferase-like enzyme
MREVLGREETEGLTQGCKRLDSQGNRGLSSQYRATELGHITKPRLEDMKGRYWLIGDVRGLGSMVGVELVTNRTTKEPASEQTR